MFIVLSGMLHFELELRNSYLGILQQSDSYMIRKGIAELIKPRTAYKVFTNA